MKEKENNEKSFNSSISYNFPKLFHSFLVSVSSSNAFIFSLIFQTHKKSKLFTNHNNSSVSNLLKLLGYVQILSQNFDF